MPNFDYNDIDPRDEVADPNNLPHCQIIDCLCASKVETSYYIVDHPTKLKLRIDIALCQAHADMIKLGKGRGAELSIHAKL